MLMPAPAGRIRPVAPSPSLLTSASLLPDGTDWRSGLNWVPAIQPSYTWPYCQGGGTDKTPPNPRSRIQVQPFMIYTPMTCNLPVDPEEAAMLVSDLTESHTASALASNLWLGTGGTTDDTITPTLRRAAVDTSPTSGAWPIDAGVATLLAHYEEATGGDGGAMIHVPAQLAPYVLGGGSGGARIAWPEGNIYRGPLNSTVVLGPGYPLGESPDNSPLGHGPLMSQGPPQTYRGNPPDMAWIYVTGPVEYATGPIQLLPEVERDRIPFRTNYYQVWAERAAIVRFDPPTCFATLVTNPAPLGTFS